MAVRLVDGELDEADPACRRARRKLLGRRVRVLEQYKRAVAVDGDAAAKARAELVVEDFERQRSLIARGRQRIHERADRQVALPGERAMVTAPGQHVELELRRVRK